MMRHLKKAANMMIGVVTTQVRAAMAGLARAAGLGMILGLHAYHTRAPLQITERTNTFLKAALVNTRRRAIGVRVDCEEALLRTSHLYQVRCDCSSCL
jgi:dihydroorotase